jgi:L-lactate dehydrogenase complex protein LldE
MICAPRIPRNVTITGYFSTKGSTKGSGAFNVFAYAERFNTPDPFVENVTVQFFHTCLVNEIDPAVGMAAVHVLERRGVTVEVPRAQTCCGQPAFNAGFMDEARKAARHTVDVLARTKGPIVVPSGSCGDMLIHQYDLLLHGDPIWERRGREVAARAVEFSAFVASRPPTHVPTPIDAIVAYHPSCHLLRGLGVKDQPLALLDSVPGLARADVADGDECCGFGGLFSVKHPGISGRMLDRKLAAIERTGATRLVSCDLGCLLHLGGALHRRKSTIQVQHLAQLLDEASA